MFAALVIQASLLAHPLHLDEQPPDLRALRDLVILDATSEQPGGSGLAPDAALELAKRLRERALAGEDFEQLTRDYSNLPSAARGGVLGCFAPASLAGPLDEFLFRAELGEISEPLVTRGAVHLAQRIDALAAVMQIEVAGTGPESEAAAETIRAELDAGADFAELARARSSDRASAERGGAFAIYERGPRDALLKEAAFHARVGELVGPLRSSLGFHLLKRVPLDAVDPSLRERSFFRARAILVAHAGARGAEPDLQRTLSEALELAQQLYARILAGEDMAELAAAHDDDPGGRERRGDLGWIHRNQPDLPRFLEEGFRGEIGEPLPPMRTPFGYVVIRRER